MAGEEEVVVVVGGAGVRWEEDEWTTAGPEGRCVIEGLVEWVERKVLEKVEARERAVSVSGT